MRFFIPLLFIFPALSFAADYEDLQALGYHYEICNTCTTQYQFESVAKQESDDGRVVVANLYTGSVYAFRIFIESEPGFETELVHSITPPSEAVEVTQEVMALFNRLDEDFGGQVAMSSDYAVNNKLAVNETESTESLTTYNNYPIDRTNPVVPVNIPSSINGVNTSGAKIVITDISASDAVSNYLRLQTMGNFFDKVSKAWSILVKKLNITVTTKFSDGSSAEWILVAIFESKQPYRYVTGSAKDANNNPITAAATGSASDGGYASYSKYGQPYNGGSVSYNCIPYTIKDSNGGITNGSVCTAMYLP